MRWGPTQRLIRQNLKSSKQAQRQCDGRSGVAKWVVQFWRDWNAVLPVIRQDESEDTNAGGATLDAVQMNSIPRKQETMWPRKKLTKSSRVAPLVASSRFRVVTNTEPVRASLHQFTSLGHIAALFGSSFHNPVHRVHRLSSRCSFVLHVVRTQPFGVRPSTRIRTAVYGCRLRILHAILRVLAPVCFLACQIVRAPEK